MAQWIQPSAKNLRNIWPGAILAKWWWTTYARRSPSTRKGSPTNCPRDFVIACTTPFGNVGKKLAPQSGRILPHKVAAITSRRGIRDGRIELRKTSFFSCCNISAVLGSVLVRMKLEMIIRRFAGTFILASLILAHYHSTYWLWFTAFVGLNLLQSSFTKFCPLEIILRRFGVGSSCGVCEKEP